MASAGLRQWQRQAVAAFDDKTGEDFLAVATPGAGKTTFGLHLARRALERKSINRVIVVAPTDHLRTQWADAAQAAGIRLDPTLTNAVGPVPDAYQGYCTTYATVANKPMLHRRRTERGRTLVILDEIHHAGDGQSWGEAVAEAFDPARKRLALTGTPFRSDASERIPFVSYSENPDGSLESHSDFTYGYREALADGVVRPVMFAAYQSYSRWMNSAGEVLSGQLGAGSRKDEDTAWRTALNPRGKWIPHVIAAADDRLRDLRGSSMPDAGALMLASDQDSARAYADVIARVTGQRPVVVVSDDPRSSEKIEAFRDGDQPWVVAVRQISEGVDVPRCAVLVWATSYRTPLFFAQAVGRVVRSRARYESATVFLPAVRPLLALAADLESQRNHIVRPADDGDTHDLTDWEPGEAGGDTFTPLHSEASFAHVLSDGLAVAAGEESDHYLEDDGYLGLPGLLTPQQTAALLAKRDQDSRRRAEAHGAVAETPAPAAAVGWRDLKALRQELNRMVSITAARTGDPHGRIHARVRSAVPGPPSAQADADILDARIEYLARC